DGWVGIWSWVEVKRLLHDLPTAFDDRALALDLGLDPAFDEAERVHVLQLGLHAELVGLARPQRDVCVAAQRALLHVHIADAERTQRRSQQLQPLTRLL